MSDLDRVRKIYGQFDPHKLPTKEEYVDFGAARGEEVLDPLLEKLLNANSGLPFSGLFGGGRGAGKTTELLRFASELNKQGFIAVHMDVDRTIDLSNCDFADYLVAIALGLNQWLQLQKFSGHSNLRQYLEGKVQEVVGFFGQTVKVPSAKLKAGGKLAETEFEVRFERKATARRTLDAAFEAHAADAVRAVQDVISRIALDLLGRNYLGLVLLVDGGDKIVPYRSGEEGETQYSRIFATHATQLCSLGCHVVYSVPISFCYSKESQIFYAASGNHPLVLPMTTLRGPNKAPPGSDTPGFLLFRQMVEKRLKSVDESIGEVFTEDALKELILKSGGSPTSLMSLCQGAFVRNRSAEKLQLESVEKAVRATANAMARQIPPEYWNVLKAYKDPNEKFERTPLFMECLFYQYLYEYMNGYSWFEVNPVLQNHSLLSA